MTVKEKRIEELSRDCFISVGDAQRVYDAGYRKADEVEKQTKERIIRELSGQVLKNKTDNGFDVHVISEEDLRFIESLIGLKR